MAYVSNELISKVRNEIKAKFPIKDGWKFFIRKVNHSTIDIHIMEAPIDFGSEYKQLNRYFLEKEKNSKR